MNGYNFGDMSCAADNKKHKLTLTSMEKDEIKELRRRRMTTSEKFREWSAGILRGPLLFGVPIVLSMVMLVVLVVIYIIRPYALTRDFTRTKCSVKSYEIINGTFGSCSAGTDPFQPCIKVEVSYPIGAGEMSGTIMENEQALVNCNPCSYTFGHHGLLHQYQEACETWKENYNPAPCVDQFISSYAQVGSLYTCYFNPHNTAQVVRDLTLDLNMLIHTFSWPVLACLSYLLAWAFVSYDSRQLRLLDQSIMEDILYQRKKRELARLQASQWKKRKLSQTLGVINHTDSSLIRNGGISSFIGTCDSRTRQRSSSLPSLNNLPMEIEVASPTDLCQSTESINDLPFDIVGEDDNFDLRHLDLAVSQQNIHDLTSTYPYIPTQHTLVFSNEDVCCSEYRDIARGHSHQTLPVAPLSSFRGDGNKYGKWSIVSNGTLPNGHFSSIPDNLAISLDPRRRSLASREPTLNGFGHHSPDRSYFSGPSANRDSDHEDAVCEDEIDFYYSVVSKKPYIKNASLEKREGMQIVNMFTANDESKV